MQYQKRILVVDDYGPNREVASLFLVRDGYKVITAENGRQALDRVREEHFDLILMDIQMPGMDGFETCRTIRSLEQQRTSSNKSMPIVALTGHILEAEIEQCLKAGMNDHLTKPIRHKTLMNMVKKWTSGPLSGGSKPSQMQHLARVAEEGGGAAVKSAIPINLESALAEFMDQKEILFKVISHFLISAQKELASLKKDLASQNPELIRCTAHRIKGGAANLCAHPLCSAAEDLEKLARTKNLTGGEKKVMAIECEFALLREYIEEQLHENYGG